MKNVIANEFFEVANSDTDMNITRLIANSVVVFTNDKIVVVNKSDGSNLRELRSDSYEQPDEFLTLDDGTFYTRCGKSVRVMTGIESGEFSIRPVKIGSPAHRIPRNGDKLLVVGKDGRIAQIAPDNLKITVVHLPGPKFKTRNVSEVCADRILLSSDGDEVRCIDVVTVVLLWKRQFELVDSISLNSEMAFVEDTGRCNILDARTGETL